MFFNLFHGFASHIRGGIILLLMICMPASSMADKDITLNLKDADISTLISTVSRLTGKNFVVDPRVKGRVTVISASPLAKDEIYQIFLSILEVHGFATIPVGDIIKIVPNSKAKQGAIPTTRAAASITGDQVVTRIIRVRNVTAAQLVPILRPLIPQQGHLAAYPSKNVLIITDSARNVARLASIISKIDRVSDSEIEIITLAHASASEIVRILNGLSRGNVKSRQSTQVTFAADERTNSVLLSGEASARLRYRALISHLDTPLETDGGTRVIYLHYAKAKDLVPVLTGVSKTLQGKKIKPGSRKSALGTNVSIQADKSANALVISAPPDIIRSLQRVISKLDIRRAQVLIEAIIAEVTLDKSRELGVQWAVDGSPGGVGGVGIINFGGSSGIGSIAATAASGGIPSIGDGASLGFGKFDSTRINFAVVLRALSSDADSNILSTPSLVTLDNQQAEIVVGQNVPFVTGEFSNTGGTSSAVNPFRTIKRQDVGLTLRVTPQINEGDAIKLDIEQEISGVIPSSTGASDLTTSKRSIKTSVMIEDRRTIVLGGLIDDTLQQSHQTVPILGDIPLLGRLFSYDKTTKKKRNLMVFIRPVILRDAATESNITESKYSLIRARQLEQRKKGVYFMDDSETPLLPKELPAIPSPFKDRKKSAVETSQTSDE
ncbi:MAG TPA: type II secretion system protein GspD [Gammaproteobacteria bacterium]|nr:type II secretion system protein GspD [Gammaproteobacteria bacterium]